METVAVLHATPPWKVRAGRLLDRVHRRVGGLLFYDVFHSVVPHGDGYLVVFRRFNFVGIARVSFLFAYETDASFARRSRNRFLGLGEDPRAFRFRGRTYVLTWLYERAKQDTRMFVYDVDGRRRIDVSLPSPGFRGKNWVPFVHGSELHFIYSLAPLCILHCDLDAGRTSWRHVADAALPSQLDWGDGRRVLGRRRGGSAGLPIDDRFVLGAGHETGPGGSSDAHHVPFLYLLDMERHAISFHYPAEQRQTGIVDPTSILVRGRDLLVPATFSDGLWDFHQRFETRVLLIRDGWAKARELAART